MLRGQLRTTYARRVVSSQAQTFMQQIVAAPDDDAPRLIYADWLSEHDDPLGELIQLQCRQAAEPDDANRRAMKILENKLLKTYEEVWLEHLIQAMPLQPVVDPPKFWFERGFVATAKLSLAYAPYIAALQQRAPLLRSVTFTPSRTANMTTVPVPSVEGVFEDPVYESLATLDLNLPGGGNALAREVASATALRNLTSLGISASVWGETVSWYGAPAEQLVLDDAGAIELARSPHLRNVKHLRLASNRITVKGLRAIGQAAWRLESLDLSDNMLGDKGFITALEGPATAGLVVLGLDRAHVANDELVRLVKTKMLTQLRELSLESNGIGAKGIVALCKAFALPSLRHLRLERNSVCDAGAVAIAECAGLAQLTSFEAGHNLIGKKGGTAIALSPHLARLERLTLNEPRWKPDMTDVFANSPTLANTRIYLKGKLVARKADKKHKPAKPVAAKRSKK
jgi:uncharacterized protein (TIGR02996 family)